MIDGDIDEGRLYGAALAAPPIKAVMAQQASRLSVRWLPGAPNLGAAGLSSVDWRPRLKRTPLRGEYFNHSDALSKFLTNFRRPNVGCPTKSRLPKSIFMTNSSPSGHP
jgi:hypothetical protein